VTTVILSGNGACVEGALKSGVRFFGGYPITPSTEIAEAMSRRLPALGGKFIQMEDELSSMAAVVGASLTGLKVMTATSGPGFSLMQENLGMAVMLEVPCLLINVQRVGPSTGSATWPAQGDVMAARWGTHGDHPAIVLTPWSVQESFDLTVKAVNLAERFRTPVILLSDAIIGRLREKVDLPESVPIVDRPRPEGPPDQYKPYEGGPDGVPPMADFGRGYRFCAPTITHNERGYALGSDHTAAERLLKRLHSKVYDHLDELVFSEARWTEDAEMVVVAYGSVARSALAAVKEARSRGMKVGLLRMITLWPFPDEVISRVSQRSRALLVAEMNIGQMVEKVREAGCGASEVFSVNRFDGEYLMPQQVLDKLEEVYGHGTDA